MENQNVNPNHGIIITSLVLGIVAILFNWVPLLGLICGIVGIVLAVKAMKGPRSGMLTAGLVTSIVGTVLSVIIGSCVGIGCVSACVYATEAVDRTSSYKYGYDYDYDDYDYDYDDDTFHW